MKELSMWNVFRNCVLVSLSVLVSVSCTQEANRISYASPLKFVYDESLVGGENAAKIGEEVVTVSQLYSPSPALQELETRINRELITTVYAKALAQKAEGKDVAVVFGFAEPQEGLKAVLKEKINKDITVTFDDKAKDAAQINGATLTREQVSRENLLMAKLMAESYKQKMQSLEGILSRRMILQESKKANVTMEDYIKQNVLKGQPEITAQDVAQYAAKNNISEKELDEETQAKLKDIIMGRRREQLIIDYVAKNVITQSIHVGFRESRVQMTVPELEKIAPVIGSGPINITLLSQFQCKECRQVEQSLVDLAEDQPKYFKLNYVFNFTEGHPEERMIAEAALCLRKQKEDYFWQFPQFLAKTEGSALEEDINSTAKSLGANFEEFRGCFLAREFKDIVEGHAQKSKEMGFYRSPVVVLDGRVYETPVDSAQVLLDARELRAEKGLGFNLFYNLKKLIKGS